MAPDAPRRPRDPALITADLDGCRDAHERLLARLAGLTDADVRAPSLLPGWTVGHVLTHIARNAESFRRVSQGLLDGVPATQYPGGDAQRTGDIEAGAGRPASDLVADVRDSAGALLACWARLTPARWAGSTVAMRAGDVPASTLPLARWREVEIHHADLGRGYSPADWPEAYVRAELPVLLGRLADASEVLDEAQVRALVVALAGRSDAPVHLPAVVT
jgi:maleylpyruvate isomerase